MLSNGAGTAEIGRRMSISPRPCAAISPRSSPGSASIRRDAAIAAYRAVGEAGDAEHALEQIVRLRPDVVLMDVSLPGMSGVEATRRLTALAPGVRILVLTVAADDQTVRPRRRLRLPTQGHPD
jgi:CheY-like chemotaxis protein